MKSICLTPLLALITWSAANAQTNIPFARSLEVFGETGGATGGRELHAVGFGLKKRVRPVRSWKMGAQLNFLNETGNTRYRSLGNDTIQAFTTHTRVMVASLSGGLEAERQFYKKVHLVAGLELRAGYGGGEEDTATSYYQGSIYAGTGLYSISSPNGERVTMFMEVLRPYIGSRVYFGRFYAGLDLASLFTGTQRSYHNSGRRYGQFDFDIPAFQYRATLGMRL